MPAAPMPSDLKARYPAFAGVDDATVQIWLTDAARIVDDSWSDGDFAPGMMSLAAHNMMLLGFGATNGSAVNLPAGVSSFRSGSFEVQLSTAAANASAKGGYAATLYGREFETMLRRNKGGPLVLRQPIPACGYPPLGYPYP